MIFSILTVIKMIMIGNVDNFRLVAKKITAGGTNLMLQLFSMFQFGIVMGIHKFLTNLDDSAPVCNSKWNSIILILELIVTITWQLGIGGYRIMYYGLFGWGERRRKWGWRKTPIQFIFKLWQFLYLPIFPHPNDSSQVVKWTLLFWIEVCCPHSCQFHSGAIMF